MAGLLDALFDPSLYSGQGGLLARLAPSLGAIQPNQGFADPGASFNERFPQQPGFAERFNALPNAAAPEQATPMQIGSYQMPRVGSEAQYAAIPQNAQQTQGQLPQPQQVAPPTLGPQRSVGFLDRFNAGLQSLGNGGSVIGALTGNYTDPRAIAQQDQRTAVEAFKAAGLTPSQATLAALYPKLAENMLGVGGTDDIKEYQFAKRENPALTFEKFMAQKKATSGEYGMTPIWGTGPDGKPAVLQLGKSGDAKQSVLPPGFNLARDPIKVEGPTGTTILDPQTRLQVGFIPKDVAGKEAAEKRGQAQGTAQAALANGADVDAEQTKKKIDEFINHKGFNEVFGQLDQFRPSWTHSNEGADALARYKQLKGVTFLTAYQMLKGGGAITDIEGQKAGDAMARLDRAQSEEEAKQALRDFREAVDIGLQKLRRAGGGESATASVAPKRIRLNADGTIAQ